MGRIFGFFSNDLLPPCETLGGTNLGFFSHLFGGFSSKNLTTLAFLSSVSRSVYAITFRFSYAV